MICKPCQVAWFGQDLVCWLCGQPGRWDPKTRIAWRDDTFVRASEASDDQLAFPFDAA